MFNMHRRVSPPLIASTCATVEDKAIDSWHDGRCWDGLAVLYCCQRRPSWLCLAGVSLGRYVSFIATCANTTWQRLVLTMTGHRKSRGVRDRAREGQNVLPVGGELFPGFSWRLQDINIKSDPNLAADVQDFSNDADANCCSHESHLIVASIRLRRWCFGNKTGIIKWTSKVRRSRRPMLLVQIESRVSRIALAPPIVLPGKER